MTGECSIACMMVERNIKGIPASVNNVDAIVSASGLGMASYTIEEPPILYLYV